MFGNFYIFVICNSHSFIPRTLKVVGPLGKKSFFSVPKKLSETLETREVYENVYFCSSRNLSNDPNSHLSMRTIYFLITTSQDVFTKYYDARTT